MRYLIAIFALVAPAIAMAGQPYVAGQAGATFLHDADNAASGSPTIESTFDTGYNLGIRAGYQFGQARVEGEVQYAENDLNDLNVSGSSLDADGDVSSTAFMANFIYAFLPQQRVHPYVGAGVGVAHVSINDARVGNAGVADDSDTVFAYQLMVGVEYDVTQQVALYGDYHYLGTDDPTFEGTSGSDFDSEYNSSNVSVGVRYTF